MKRVFFFLFFLCSQVQAVAQDPSIDSLTNMLSRSEERKKAHIYWKLSRTYTRINLDSTLKYSELAIQWGEKYGLKEPLAWGLLYRGNALGEKGFYDSCIESESRGLAMIEESKNQEAMARAYMIVGNGFAINARDDSAIHYFLKSADLGKEFGYAEGYVGLAKIYNRTRDYKTGLFYANKAYKESGPSEIETKIRSLGMAGRCYSEFSMRDTAITLTKAALTLSRKYDKQIHIGNFTSILGDMYIEQGNFSLARPLVLESYAISKKLNSKDLEAGCLVCMAKIAFGEGDNWQAIQKGLEGYKLAQGRQASYIIYDASFVLMKAYLMMGNVKEAEIYQAQIHKARIADFEVANSRAIIDYKIKYETLQKEHENADLKTRQSEIERTVDKQRAIVFIVGFALVLTVIGGVLIARAYQNKKRLNELLEMKNAAILSINEEMKSRQEEIARQKNEIEKQREQLVKALLEREETQSHLVHSEKMASLGQLMAGIAHELNNPINFISAGTLALRDKLARLKKHFDSANENSKEQIQRRLLDEEDGKITDEFWQENENLIKAVLVGAERTTRIVNSLRTFSYETSDGVQQVDLIECIEAILTMLQSEIKNRIEILKDYEPIPLVECNGGEIAQVLMNIVSNAVQAINGKGTIRITTGLTNDNNKVLVSVKDSGVGIPKNVIKRIFDPFFTTKPMGKGTGLGLSISYKLIEKHHGSIEVTSSPSAGTEFIITIPVKSLSS